MKTLSFLFWLSLILCIFWKVPWIVPAILFIIALFARPRKKVTAKEYNRKNYPNDLDLH